MQGNIYKLRFNTSEPDLRKAFYISQGGIPYCGKWVSVDAHVSFDDYLAFQKFLAYLEKTLSSNNMPTYPENIRIIWRAFLLIQKAHRK